MAKETKNTEKEKEQFIFIDTCVIEAMNKSNAIKTLTDLAKKFTIVIPSWQLTELQKHFIRRFTGKPKDMEQGLANIRIELKDGFEEESKEFEEYFKTLSNKIITKRKEELGQLLELLKKQRVLVTAATHHYLGERRGRGEFIAPYENKQEGDKGYHNRFNDSIFWETLLQSSDDDNGIPLGSNLEIYTTDKAFFQDENPKEINVLLKTEWELLKKGTLKLYEEPETKTQNKEQPTENDKPTPPELRPPKLNFSNNPFSNSPYEHKVSGYLSRMNYLLNKMKSPISFDLKRECLDDINTYYREVRRYTNDFEKIAIAREYLDEAKDIVNDYIPF